MSLYKKIEDKILQELKDKLPPALHYHSVSHVQDVLAAAEQISKAEGLSEEEINLVKTAALFHDAGFMISPENHEEKGCRIAREVLKKHGYDDTAIQQVCEMIMATKVPQSPKNKMAEILCDADLDYLGREDFTEISETLFSERKATGIVESRNDWNLKQVQFLKSHRYFTSTSRRLRNEQKQKHLDMLTASLEK